MPRLGDKRIFDSWEENSHMRMKLQGRLVQARFTEIHPVLAKKKSDTFLTE